jgi:hypothetical protein
MCNKNMLTITKNLTGNKFNNLSYVVTALLALLLPDSLMKYVSINKQLIDFQNCFGAQSGPG